MPRAQLPTRPTVLALYKRILRTGMTWPGPEEEREYIRDEARNLFRKNMNLTDPERIEEKIFEGQSR